MAAGESTGLRYLDNRYAPISRNHFQDGLRERFSAVDSLRLHDDGVHFRIIPFRRKQPDAVTGSPDARQFAVIFQLRDYPVNAALGEADDVSQLGNGDFVILLDKPQDRLCSFTLLSRILEFALINDRRKLPV